MNILPIIAAWIEEFSHANFFNPHREHLKRWLKHRVVPDELDLAADCMIAAGIGNEAEQDRTVYCGCWYEADASQIASNVAAHQDADLVLELARDTDTARGGKGKDAAARFWRCIQEAAGRELFKLQKPVRTRRVTIGNYYEFRNASGQVVDWRSLCVWRNVEGDGQFYTGAQFGWKPMYLHQIGNPEPCLLLIDGKEVAQHDSA